MDINVKVTVDATDEVKDLLKLLVGKTTAESTEEKPAKKAKVAGKTKSKSEPKPEPEEEDDDDIDTASGVDDNDDQDDEDDDDIPDVKVSFENLRALGRKKMQTDEAKAKVRTFMMKKFKTAKLPELTEDQWPAMYAYLENL